MIRRTALAVSALALGIAGCAAEEGGGPLGIVAFDRNHHVSAAEPLFGKHEDRCLDSPAFLMSTYKETLRAQDLAFLPEGHREGCARVIGAIRAAMALGQFYELRAPPAQNPDPYSDRQRNEAIDALIAASNRKCGRYIAFLQQYDANINSTLGIAAQTTAILASIASGGTAQGLAAASGIAGGARGTLNNAHFQNQTIAVLTNAFENSRAQQRLDISRRQQCSPAKYTLMRGLEDAFRYHSSCSIVFGLKQAQRAVEEANSPNIESFSKMLDQIAAAQLKMKKLTGGGGGGGGETPAHGQAPGAADEGGDEGTGGSTAPTSGSQGTTDAPGTASGAGASAAEMSCPFDPPAATPAAKKG